MFNTWKKILEGGDPATLAHPVDRYNVCDTKPQGAAPKADDPLHVLQALQSVGKSKYGSLSGEIEALRARKLRKLDAGIAKRLFIDEKGCSEEKHSASDQSVCQPVYAKSNHQAHFHVETDVKGVPESIIIVESDGEDGEAHGFSHADDVHLDAGIKGVSKSIITTNMEEADPVTRMPSESNLQTNASVRGPDRERSTNELMVGNCSEGEPVKEAVGTPNTLDKGKDKCWGSRFSIQLMVEGKCPKEDLANSSGETGTSRHTNFKNIIDHVHLSALEDTLTPKETINCVDEVAAEMEEVAHDSLEREVSGREVGSSPSSKGDTIECLYNGTDDNLDIEEGNYPIDEEDDLSNIWMEMAFSMECSKDVAMDAPFMKEKNEHDEGDCDHSFVLKEDIGHVCRICGLVQRSIETIFEFNYSKGRRTTRTYASAYQKTDKREQNVISPDGVSYLEYNSMTNQIVAHPRHHKQMRTHQLEGFNFLCSNLLADEPGGCILAHAPGSGKTFMIISFIQGFLAKYPRGRPLVVLPKGILATWKKEFQAWQVEDIPLLDFYSSKAENRHQQLDVLKQWINQKSILFLGYNQFSKIVCDFSSNKVTADCQDILLTKPTILILDEGHTPRNEDTDVLTSLSRVQTPRKVALSGTLYQNHVEEVFNILNLVRPKFLEFKTSKAAVNRIMSRVDMTGAKRQSKPGTSSAFFEAVEHTLQRDENFQRKMAVVQDLREMTSKVLHFYKGDFLDELPGLVDFTVLLNLTAVQKVEAQKLMKLDRFKRIAAGGAVYMHPELKYFAEKYPGTGDKSSAFDNEKIDAMLQNLIVEHGVKLKFFINILGLCESAGEKLLVFSQYILPLKLLERICVKQKGWSPGKEMFMITGDTNTEQRDRSMEQFNGSPNAKVFFGSIKACGEGISLVGASRILILDVHLNPSVSRQAIGRAFRPGQKRKVYAYRLVAADSQEEADNLTCFRKELISKLWFEWDGSCSNKDLDGMAIEVDECGDMFFESPVLREDVKAIYKRRFIPSLLFHVCLQHQLMNLFYLIYIAFVLSSTIFQIL